MDYYYLVLLMSKQEHYSLLLQAHVPNYFAVCTWFVKLYLGKSPSMMKSLSKPLRSPLASPECICLSRSGRTGAKYIFCNPVYWPPSIKAHKTDFPDTTPLQLQQPSHRILRQCKCSKTTHKRKHRKSGHSEFASSTLEASDRACCARTRTSSGSIAAPIAGTRA